MQAVPLVRVGGYPGFLRVGCLWFHVAIDCAFTRKNFALICAVVANIEKTGTDQDSMLEKEQKIRWHGEVSLDHASAVNRRFHAEIRGPDLWLRT
jgi:hypothetical protein